jgi:hypothetical protein
MTAFDVKAVTGTAYVSTMPGARKPIGDEEVSVPADVIAALDTARGTLTAYVPAVPVPVKPKPFNGKGPRIVVPTATPEPVMIKPGVIVPVTVPETVSIPAAVITPVNETEPAAMTPTNLAPTPAGQYVDTPLWPTQVF